VLDQRFLALSEIFQALLNTGLLVCCHLFALVRAIVYVFGGLLEVVSEAVTYAAELVRAVGAALFDFWLLGGGFFVDGLFGFVIRALRVRVLAGLGRPLGQCPRGLGAHGLGARGLGPRGLGLRCLPLHLSLLGAIHSLLPSTIFMRKAPSLLVLHRSGVVVGVVPASISVIIAPVLSLLTTKLAILIIEETLPILRKLFSGRAVVHLCAEGVIFEVEIGPGALFIGGGLCAESAAQFLVQKLGSFG
jgi:hypothetical protein